MTEVPEKPPVPAKLPDMKKLLKQAHDEAYGEQKSQLVLAKEPIPTEPEGEPNLTQAVQKRRFVKMNTDRVYQQLGTTATAINQLRVIAMSLQRMLEQMPRGNNTKNASKSQKALHEERASYDDILKRSVALLRDLKVLGSLKAQEAKEMERQLTAARTDIYRAHRRQDETEADKQNRKGIPLEQPCPMHTAPNVTLSPKKLLLTKKPVAKEALLAAAKEEIQAKENTKD